MPVQVISDIDKHIKNTFHLFLGKRSKEEDTLLYHQVYDLCFDEMLLFLQEHLEEYKLNILVQHLETVSQSSLCPEKKQDMSLDLVMGSLEDIPHYRTTLFNRLAYFVSGLSL